MGPRDFPLAFSFSPPVLAGDVVNARRRETMRGRPFVRSDEVAAEAGCSWKLDVFRRRMATLLSGFARTGSIVERRKVEAARMFGDMGTGSLTFRRGGR